MEIPRTGKPIARQAVADAINPELPIDDKDRIAILTHLAIEFLRGPQLEVGSGQPGEKQRVTMHAGIQKTVPPGRYGMALLDVPPDDAEPLTTVAEPEDPVLQEERVAIIEALNEYWDFTDLHPIPRKWPTCHCGNQYAWLIRYWGYHEYSDYTKTNVVHRFRRRVDVSMKCQACSYVGVWGVIIPDSWWDERGIEGDRIGWKEVPEDFQKRIKRRRLEAMEGS